MAALLAPRKEKGSKISAINEDGDHESEAEKELRKGQVGRKPPVATRKVPMIVKK